MTGGRGGNDGSGGSDGNGGNSGSGGSLKCGVELGGVTGAGTGLEDLEQYCMGCEG